MTDKIQKFAEHLATTLGKKTLHEKLEAAAPIVQELDEGYRSGGASQFKVGQKVGVVHHSTYGHTRPGRKGEITKIHAGNGRITVKHDHEGSDFSESQWTHRGEPIESNGQVSRYSNKALVDHTVHAQYGKQEQERHARNDAARNIAEILNKHKNMHGDQFHLSPESHDMIQAHLETLKKKD